ncbi:hypothetical protein RP20_CCG001848 [Aedes albopictus]|nr:hypothetical protein RP20_CCG001848 [Aedes albopictus]
MLQKLLLLFGKEKFVSVNILIHVSGGGHATQVYAIRQSIPKELVSFYQKYVDEASRKELKDILIPGRTLAVPCCHCLAQFEIEERSSDITHRTKNGSITVFRK